MDEFEWNVTNEGQLLEAMIGHKPVGINKYFQMAFICDKFIETCKEITSERIWKHLEAMYNLEALDESEKIPFPNAEKDFLLPDSDFGPLLTKKEEEEKKSTQKGRETPKLKEIKKEDKTPLRSSSKESQRRDSKDTKEKTPANTKKEIKKESEKGKGKGKISTNTPKEDKKSKSEETPKPVKRPLRGSLKPDDSSSSGKSSPVTVTPAKRRRI